MQPIRIGSRRELFVDDFLISCFEGDVALHLHQPEPGNVAISTDQPWESSWAYFAVMKDENLFRMYYRGFHHGKGEQALGEPMCYAESHDGITWNKPELGLFVFEGSSANNIVLGGDLKKFPATSKWHGDLGSDIRWRGDFVPFIDTRSGVTPDARYKALIRGCRGFHQIAERRWDYGMYPFQSPDGLNWTLLHDQPVITRGKFDSQNLGFWDAAHQRYVAFCRDISGQAEFRFSKGQDTEFVAMDSIRGVRVAFSDDFIQWTDPVFIEYEDEDIRQLYTNAVQPYARAPHLLIAFPTEFFANGSQTEPVFMTSRDGGKRFHRWEGALISRDAPFERDGNRSNYMAHGAVQGNARELFVYATEGYFEGQKRLRRFVYRTDGFVSAQSGSAGGGVVTHPVVFKGEEMVVNYATKPGGRLRIEIQNADGQPIAGFRETDCVPMTGDAIEQAVVWKGEEKLQSLEGQGVRIRFVIQHADIYSFKFT